MKSVYIFMMVLLGSQTAAALAQDSPFEQRAGFNPSSPLQLAQAELGCCVLLASPKAKCASTNKAYCESRAKQGNVQFTFHPDVNCNQVAECK